MLCELRVNQPSVYPLPGVGRVIGDFTLPQFSTPLSLFCWSMILAIISFFVTNDVCLVKKGKNCLVFLFIYFYFYFYFISVSQCTCDWISVYGHLWPAAGWKRPAWRLGSIALRERKRRIRLFRNRGARKATVGTGHGMRTCEGSRPVRFYIFCLVPDGYFVMPEREAACSGAVWRRWCVKCVGTGRDRVAVVNTRGRTQK